MTKKAYIKGEETPTEFIDMNMTMKLIEDARIAAKHPNAGSFAIQRYANLVAHRNLIAAIPKTLPFEEYHARLKIAGDTVYGKGV